MTTYENTGRPGYVYDEATDTWYQLSGKPDTSSGYEWAGSHSFLSTVNINDHFISQKGINNFLNPAARDAAIPSPSLGTICIVRQSPSGTAINEIQIYDGSGWNGPGDFVDVQVQIIMGSI